MVSRKTNDVISGFGSSCSTRHSGWSRYLSLLPSSPYLYTNSGRLAIASDNMRTQEYTAVICMAVFSLTTLPEDEPPHRKLVPPPRFLGLSRALNIPLKMFIGNSLQLKNEQSACVIHAFARIVSAPNCTVKRHDGGDCAVDFFSGFFFIRFDVACRVGSDEDIVHHPA